MQKADIMYEFPGIFWEGKKTDDIDQVYLNFY